MTFFELLIFTVLIGCILVSLVKRICECFEYCSSIKAYGQSCKSSADVKKFLEMTKTFMKCGNQKTLED